MLLDKPQSMSVREWLVKSLSRRDFIPEITISAIIRHQYDEANLKLKEKNSIEISGFGKFYYSEGKAEKQMVRYLVQKKVYQEILDNKNISEKKRHSYNQRMEANDVNIAALKLKK